MRIEQYFLMTDYALWEVIVNGDSPPPKRTVDVQSLMVLSNSANTDSMSDAVIYSFFANQSNNPQLDNEMDLKFDQGSKGEPGTKPVRRELHRKTAKDKRFGAQDGRAYKAGLETVEAKLDGYKKNEVVFEENIKILKLDIMLRDNALTELRKKFEKAKKERDDLKLTLEKFENSSKNPQQPVRRFNVPVVATSKVKTSESKPKSVSEPLIEDWISNSEDENETKLKSKQRKPSFAKVEFVKFNEHVKIPRESVEKVKNNKQAKYPRKIVKVLETVGPKAVVSGNKGHEANAVKASACWVWRPKQKVLDHVSRHNGASMNFKRFDYVDTRNGNLSLSWLVSLREPDSLTFMQANPQLEGRKKESLTWNAKAHDKKHVLLPDY
ncbi:hypothetical protein Tco_0481309 [Tanacetum coccineum]